MGVRWERERCRMQWKGRFAARGKRRKTFWIRGLTCPRASVKWRASETRIQQHRKRPGLEERRSAIAQSVEQMTVNHWVPGLLAAQQAGPVRQLALLFPCLHPAALPQGVVRVLDRQSRQRYLEPSTIGGIELDQFLDHHLHRPTVGHDVMLDQHQHMVVLGQPQQAHPQQRPTLQVERPRDRRLDLPSEGALLERPQRDDIQRQCHGCGDLLARLVAVEAKTGA